MDDVIQVLIFLFVIWSLLGSAFKKKPEPQKQQQQNRQKSGTQKKTTNYSAKDVLEDIFGVPLPKTENEHQDHYGKRHSPNDYDSDWQVEYRNLEKTKSVESKELSLVDYDKLASLEVHGKTRRVKPAEIFTFNTSSTNERTREIKSKFKDINSIRDAVIIAEILNKPKALRS
ncbi:MAG: hypothetical protein AB1394_06285 [Bacteroidota bacterium]